MNSYTSITNEGRAVASMEIGWGEASSFITAKPGIDLTLHCEHHGEYDIDWVIQTENHRETARYAVNQYTSIVWL